ncbi:sporulation membrane protein YtrI [Priestia taiwanensis]|uniref:Sporulation membrane protein YtrI C-terminal domain-containing protein n=1 Tax=Priestia taiwanensis TaxID=1347902 RepID=A0A917AX27_9BACI|nr:sporulation membrane protein YtrI [Priestia taiwanensis]MBM7363458.1 hypothetical protein [Priestia taiwanensis]GGE76996.1 hypothetical protein GCM10007140_28330 [Priestia taiwanensis]
MRIPTLYKEKKWQLFFAGAAIGGIISWTLFLYIHGTFLEAQRQLVINQTEEIRQLKLQANVLLEDKQKLNEENKQKLVIQEINIAILQAEKYNITSLLKEQLTRAVYKDLRHLLLHHVESVAQNKEILTSAIENKTYEIDDSQYTFAVKTIFFYTTLEIELEIKRK